MGDFSTPVICIIILSLLVICESLPLQADDQQHLHPHTTNKETHKETGLYEEKLRLRSAMDSLKNYTNDVLQSFSILKFISHFEHLTKKLLKFLLHLEVNGKNNAKTENVIEMNAEDFIESEDTKNGIFFQNRWRTKGSKIHTKKFKKEITDVHSDNFHVDKNNNSKTVPKHRKHRERRSFLHEYGLALSYSDSSGDVIFGAHTSPCAYKDRHYCLNGGTCVFVGALEIKTCQCKIGYTGLRCQSINQEFLMALLSEEFFG